MIIHNGISETSVEFETEDINNLRKAFSPLSREDHLRIECLKAALQIHCVRQQTIHSGATLLITDSHGILESYRILKRELGV